MRRDLIAAVVSVVVLTVILGVAYPLVMTGASQVLFHNKANGSQIKVDGRVVGSALLGQDFRGVKRYFQSRPSADSYNPSATTFANLGPNSAELRDELEQNAAAYMKLEGPYDPALRRNQVPVDAVTTSASGLDPLISLDNADIQAHRVAAIRHLPLSKVNAMVKQYTDGRDLGVMGDPGVNVLELNLALDRESAQ